MKLEVADLEQPQIIRVATITNIMGRMLQLFFDGQSKFQFVDFESPDIYPIGWCKRTGHTLHSPFGPSKCLYVAFAKPYHGYTFYFHKRGIISLLSSLKITFFVNSF